MNYEDLTKRIEITKKAAAKEEIDFPWRSSKDYWNGYLAALHDIRNDINTGGKKGGENG